MFKHKFLSLFVALIAATNLFASDIQVDGIWYDFDDTNLTASVTYRGVLYDDYSNEYTGLVVIPASVSYNSKTYSVITIGFSAFYGCSGLTSVSIPNSVTEIVYGAFEYCTGLTSVTIPNSVTTIEDWAFGYCSGLTSVTIPNTVATIGAHAFSDCSGLTITIPNSVTTIGEGAFSLVNDIEYSGTATGSPWGAKCVNGYVDGYFVYSDATKVKLCGCFTTATGTITIPNSVTTIGDYAFSNCNSLTSVTIPNSVTTIGEGAFRNCSGLTSVTIPNSVTTIEGGAFMRCSSLTSVTIPNSVIMIEYSAFDGCEGLTSVTIPNSVITIGDNAFHGCSGLTSITIPNSVTTIGMDAFKNCNNLKTVYNGSSMNITEGSSYNGYVAFYADKVYNGIPVGDLVIKNDTIVTAYIGTGTDIIIPDGITMIGDDAFSNCSTLISAVISNSVETIGESAFANCPTLTSVVISNSVETIGESAFANCTYLTDVTIGANVKEIGCNTFAGDFRLENITCYAPITPNVCSTTFSGINKFYVYLYVLESAQRKYQVDPNWAGFNLHLIGAEEKPITGDEVIVTPSTDNATFTWPANPSADGYSIEITKDGVVFCTFKFNAQGQLTGIAFAPSRDGAREMAFAEMTTNGWQFTVTGLSKASKYGYTLDVLDASQQSIKHYQGEFMTDGYTDLEGVTMDNTQCTVRKFIRNNQLQILRNGKLYNALGGVMR